MLVPMEWLAEYVDPQLPVDDLARRLTIGGLNVESIERPAEKWQDVLIGEVLDVREHPKSRNPLWVASVGLGERTVTIVTGAPNVVEGAKVPTILVGGLLPHGPDGAPLLIQARPMAGIISEGMLASERELGISDEHEGIFILPPAATVGRPMADVLGDIVLDLETHANRPDTLSIVGIAREVAALTETQLRLLDLDGLPSNVTVIDEDSYSVDVEDPDLCPRYTALRVEGVRAVPSPIWLRRRLETAGMRPISLFVDLTNYVMLELGQPMHAFDATTLHGGRIVVRRAHPGETLRTLDGTDRVMPSDTLLIADGERAIAIAGVMGGETTEIGAHTQTIILESANFDPISVRRAAKSLGLRTEASSRFEKGLPVETAPLGARRYVQLLADITGQPLKVARLTDVHTGDPPAREVWMPLRDLHRLVGLPITLETAAEKLRLLGFQVVVGDDGLTASVPFWRRVDIECSADLVEEVARLVGYDEIPVTLPRRTMPPAPLPSNLQRDSIVRNRLLGMGVSEAVTGVLTHAAGMGRLFPPASNHRLSEEATDWAQLIPNAAGVRAMEAMSQPLRLLNPPTNERDMPRLTLLPGLLDALVRNFKHTEERLAFFEIAPAYFSRGADVLPYERRTLGIALSGNRRPRTWLDPSPGSYTFYDLKGMLAGVLEDLHIGAWSTRSAPHPALHPGRSALLTIDEREVGFLGELHPRVAAAFDFAEWPVIVGEFDLDTVYALSTETRIFEALPRYPTAHRDIAVLMHRETPASEIVRLLYEAGGSLVRSARIFDVYSGESLPSGKKSVAVELELYSTDATLTQEQINAVMQSIVDALSRELGAVLRE
jgi:phenylalanyl-tRNA synthetase beta chain